MLRVAAASAGIQYEDNRLRTLASYDGVSIAQGDALGLCSSSAGVNLSGNQRAIMIGQLREMFSQHALSTPPYVGHTSHPTGYQMGDHQARFHI